VAQGPGGPQGDGQAAPPFSAPLEGSGACAALRGGTPALPDPCLSSPTFPQEKLEKTRRFRSYFLFLAPVIFFFAAPLPPSHVNDKDIKEAAKQESSALKTSPDKGFVEICLRLNTAVTSFKESAMYIGDTVTDTLAILAMFAEARKDGGDDRARALGIIQLIILLMNLRLMGWIIGMAGFSIMTVEDKFDPNALVGFNYVAILWLPPPISSLILGLDFLRVKVKRTPLRNLFACFLEQQDVDTSSSERLTYEPLGGTSASNQINLWDVLTEGVRRTWIRARDIKRARKAMFSLSRNDVDLSVGQVGKDGGQAGVFKSIYQYKEEKREVFGERQEAATKQEEMVVKGKGVKEDKKAKKDASKKAGGNALNVLKADPRAPKNKATEVLGLCDMDWNDWQDKRMALGDESLPFFVRKLTSTDVTGLAATAGASSLAAKTFRFLSSTFAAEQGVFRKTLWRSWIKGVWKTAKESVKKTNNVLGKGLVSIFFLFVLLLTVTIFMLATVLFWIFSLVVVFSIALTRGLLYEIPVTISTIMVPFVTVWSFFIQCIVAVDNFRSWYQDKKPAAQGINSLDSRARAKAVIDWAEFMETFFESGPSVVVQLITFLSIDALRNDLSILISIILSIIHIGQVAFQFRKEYAKVVMVREISKRGINECFQNPSFYQFATWNDFKNITQDLHPNGLQFLTAGSDEVEAGKAAETMLHRPNLPLQVYEELLSQPGSNPNMLDEDEQSPILDHATKSGAVISNWHSQRGRGTGLMTDERVRWIQPFPIVGKIVKSMGKSYVEDAQSLIDALKDVLLTSTGSLSGKVAESKTGPVKLEQKQANENAAKAAEHFIKEWYKNDILLKEGEHSYIYLVAALKAIKRYYAMEQFVSIPGKDSKGIMPPRVASYVLSLVQRAQDVIAPNSFLIWALHASGFGSELLRVPIQSPHDPFYAMDALLGHSAMIVVKDSHGDTALHKACKFPQPFAACAVYKLLKYGANPWATNKAGQTPLHLACMFLTSESEHVIRELLASDAVKGRKREYVTAVEDSTGDSALHKVAKNAWTFTTCKTAGISKKYLPRRVRKAMLNYMHRVALDQDDKFANLALDDLDAFLDFEGDGQVVNAGASDFIEDASSKYSDLDAAPLRDKVKEHKRNAGLDVKDIGEVGEKIWRRARLDKDLKREFRAWGARTQYTKDKAGASDISVAPPKAGPVAGPSQLKGSARQVGAAVSQREGTARQVGAAATTQRKAAGDGREATGREATAKPEDKKKAKEAAEKARADKKAELYEKRAAMRGAHADEGGEDDDVPILVEVEGVEGSALDVDGVPVLDEIIHKSMLDMAREDGLLDGVPEEGTKAQQAAISALDTDRKVKLIQYNREKKYLFYPPFLPARAEDRPEWVREVLIKEGKMGEWVTVMAAEEGEGPGEQVPKWVMDKWLLETRAKSSRAKKVRDKPAKFLKDAEKVTILGEWAKEKKKMEAAEKRSKLTIRSGQDGDVRRGELGGLSFTGFYGQGADELNNSQFQFAKRRYASDEDMAFLPGCEPYGREWLHQGLAWRPNMQKAMVVARMLLDAGADAARRNNLRKTPAEILAAADAEFNRTTRLIIRRLVKNDIYATIYEGELDSDEVRASLETKARGRLDMKVTLAALSRNGVLHKVAENESDNIDSSVVFWTQVPTTRPLKEFLERWVTNRGQAQAMHDAFMREMGTNLKDKPFELGWGDLANEDIKTGADLKKQWVEEHNNVDECGLWEYDDTYAMSPDDSEEIPEDDSEEIPEDDSEEDDPEETHV